MRAISRMPTTACVGHTAHGRMPGSRPTPPGRADRPAKQQLVAVLLGTATTLTGAARRLRSRILPPQGWSKAHRYMGRSPLTRARLTAQAG